MVNGEGTVGKMLNDNSLYTSINSTVSTLQGASLKAQQIMASVAGFSSNLNKKGTLANELITDTVVFNSVKASVQQLHEIADTASLFIANLKQAGSNRNSTLGVLLHDEETGSNVKESIKNLEVSSRKLNEDLKALQQNIFFRKYFKNQAKSAATESK